MYNSPLFIIIAFWESIRHCLSWLPTASVFWTVVQISNRQTKAKWLVAYVYKTTNDSLNMAVLILQVVLNTTAISVMWLMTWEILRLYLFLWAGRLMIKERIKGHCKTTFNTLNLDLFASYVRKQENLFEDRFRNSIKDCIFLLFAWPS